MSTLMEHTERAERKRYNLYDFDTTVFQQFNERIFNLVRRRVEAENAIIEADLKTIPGVFEGMTQQDAEPLNLEVCYQERIEPPMGHRYRGIRQHGTWVIDHHPEWGEVRG